MHQQALLQGVQQGTAEVEVPVQLHADHLLLSVTIALQPQETPMSAGGTKQ